MSNEGDLNNTSSDSNDRVVYEVRVNDVLFGRGALKNGHPGNVNYRQMVHNRKAEYNVSTRHREKNFIAQDIINTITVKNNGRFLREVRTSAEAKAYGVEGGIQAWIIESAAAINAKVKQALREGGVGAFGDVSADSDEGELDPEKSCKDPEQRSIIEAAAAIPFSSTSHVPCIGVSTLGQLQQFGRLGSSQLYSILERNRLSPLDQQTGFVTSLDTLVPEHLIAMHQIQDSHLFTRRSSLTNNERTGSSVPYSSQRLQVPTEMTETRASGIDQLEMVQQQINNEIMLRRLLQLTLPQSRKIEALEMDPIRNVPGADFLGHSALLNNDVKPSSEVSSNIDVKQAAVTQKRKYSAGDDMPQESISSNKRSRGKKDKHSF